jgi:hypothetical protein
MTFRSQAESTLDSLSSEVFNVVLLLFFFPEGEVFLE